MDLRDAVAVVSGGASGLGEATVRRLVAGGAKVIIADVNEERGEALATELGNTARFSRCDVSVAEDVQATVDVARALGCYRIAVSCAGVGWAARTVDRTGKAHALELYEKVIAVNQIGTFNLLRLSAAAMMDSDANDLGERGVIVNTASVAAFDGQIGQLAYAASKAAIVGMTLPAARDLGKSGIRVVTIAPGVFETPMMASVPEEARQHLAKQVVFPQRLGDPAWFAQLALDVVRNPYINGEVVRIDGALRMPPR